MAFIRKLPDTPERLEHLKGGAGQALLSSYGFAPRSR